MTDEGTDGTGGGSDSSSSKVDRIIEKYDLAGMREELERRWLGEGRDRQSLRDLADYFNRRILQRAMADANLSPLEGEVENLYTLLTDDDVTEGARTQARNTLEREGVDAAAVHDDFVSHYAIHTYLRDDRGVEYPGSDDETQIHRSIETIRRLTSRLTAVTKRNVETLRSTDRLAVGGVNVIADVQVICRDCGRQYDATALLERGGCVCRRDE